MEIFEKTLDNQYNSAKCEEQIAMAKQIIGNCETHDVRL